jgi:predicted nucleotidyltransferase
MKTLLTDSELKNEIVRIIRSQISGDLKVYLFGSRATGNEKTTSDYDICIDSGKRIPGEVMQNIREDLEILPVMQKIDLSDWYTLNSAFQDQIKNNGIILDFHEN